MRDKFVNVEVDSTGLRALLFWANIGVGKSNVGSYGNTIENVIESYANFMRFNLKRNKFGSLLPRSKKAKP